MIFRILIYITLIFYGCSKPVRVKVKECLKYSNQVQLAPKTDLNTEVKIYLFIDGTPSMKGFVKSQFSEYVNLISNIENIVSLSHKKSSLDYFKFGKEIYRINRDEFRKQSLMESFYSDPITYMDVIIDSAVKWGFDNKVYVIITDLFQQEGDIDKIIDKVRALPSDVSLGILMVMSKFEGIVYDVSPRALSFSFKGERPLYTLIFSKDVYLIDKIMNEISEQVKTRTQGLILSNNLQMDYFKPKLLSSKGIVKINDTIHKLSSENISLNLSLNELKIPSYAPFINQAYIKVIRCDNGSEIISQSINTNYDTLKLESNLKLKDKNYVVNVVIYSLQEPYWIKEFDMDITKIPEWINEPSKFDGSKTYNLRKFIISLFKIYDLKASTFNIYLIGG